MAACLKRSSRLVHQATTNATASAATTATVRASSGKGSRRHQEARSLRELICPICRSILCEPVTLPCAHSLCYKCLKDNFAFNSLQCPMCRLRVGSWHRQATKTDNLIDHDLWDFIQREFPKELRDKQNGDEDKAGDDGGLDTVDFEPSKPIISEAGEIKREYELELQKAKEEARKEQEKEMLVSEAYIRKIQEEEKQQRIKQLVQDRLLAKAIAKEEAIKEKSSLPIKTVNENNKPVGKSDDVQCQTNSKMSDTLDDGLYLAPQERHKSKIGIKTNSKISDTLGDEIDLPLASLGKHKSKTGIKSNSKMSDTLDDVIDLPLAPPEEHKSKTGIKSNSKMSDTLDDVIDLGPRETHKSKTGIKLLPGKFRWGKRENITNCKNPMTIVHDPVEAVVKHQTKFNSLESKNDYVGSKSKIYGLRSKEELQVPSDILNNKNKKLDIEVCVTSGEDEERIGSAESAGSHDSINQEIHHFKPIKIMPRTPLQSAGKKCNTTKLIKVKPLLKPMAISKKRFPIILNPPVSFGSGSSAFIRIQQHTVNLFSNLKENEKIDTCLLKNVTTQKSQDSKVLIHTQNESSEEETFDSNKNYKVKKSSSGPKCKVNKSALTKVEENDLERSKKVLSNGYMFGNESKNQIEIINVSDSDDDLDVRSTGKSPEKITIPKECLPLEAAVENIAERIKRRKTSKNSDDPPDINSHTELSNQIDQLNSKHRKVPRKKSDPHNISDNDLKPLMKHQILKKNDESNAKNRKSPCKEEKLPETDSKNQTNNQSKSKKQKLPNLNDSCSEQETSLQKMKKLKVNMEILPNCSSNSNISHNLSDDEVINEQKQIENQLEQEKRDRELAYKLQAEFNAIVQVSGRTRNVKKIIGEINYNIGRVSPSVLPSTSRKSPVKGLKKRKIK